MPRNELPRRSGQALILFILVMLALVGVLALTLDYGFVLLSRRAMQTAANAGALEGGKDLDSTGRENAQRVIRNLFDDDLDPTSNSTTLSAGISHSLVTIDSTGSVLGSGNGSQDLHDNRTQYLYRPNPELNPSNLEHGDFVIGNYLDGSTSHGESASYERDDFEPDNNGDAFLTRLRRTPIRTGVANTLDRETGVSSSGTGSPLLMGRLLPFIHSSSGYDLRRDGVTIRATSISQAQPVVQVGESTSTAVYVSLPYAKLSGSSTVYEIASPVFTLGQQVVLGDEVDDPATVPSGYLPILGTFDSNHYVLAFQLQEEPAGGASKQYNASPHLHLAMPTLSTLSSDAYDFVIQGHQILAADANAAIATMPALVRSTN